MIKRKQDERRFRLPGIVRVTLVLSFVVLLAPAMLTQEPGPGPTDGASPAAESPAAESPAAESPAAVPTEPATGATDGDGPSHPETYLDFAVSGGTLMIPIGICSVLLLAFIVERLLSTRRSLVLPKPFVAALQGVTSESALDRARIDSLCKSHPSSAARVLQTALRRIDEPHEEIGHAVNVTAQREIFSLRRYTRLFLIISSVAPLIGLLGTVTGMIQAFREVAIQGLGSGQALAPGIYQALITTAAGLLVAIPAMIAYYWMMSRIDHYVHGIDNLVEDFVAWGRRHVAATAHASPE